MELPNYHSYPSYLVTFDQKLPYIEPYLPEIDYEIDRGKVLTPRKDCEIDRDVNEV